MERIVSLIAGGALLETAAAAAGISRETLHSWLRKGAEQEKGLAREFSDAVFRATADVESRMSAVVTGAALNGDLDAAKWWLERRCARRWGLQVQVHVNAELDAGLDRLQAGLDEKTFGRVLGILAGEPQDEWAERLPTLAGGLPTGVAAVEGRESGDRG
jgi:hypothetical protein